MEQPAPFLLAADIDGTMLGDPAGEELLHQFCQENAGRFYLAYVTGRYRWSVMDLMAQGRLPRPDFICSDVGTSIYDCNDLENSLGKHYIKQVAPEWSLDEIYRLGVGPGIRRQEFDDGQPPHQAGFYWDADPVTLKAFYERVSALQNVNILVSYNEYIDILPAPLGKGNAVKFLQTQLGLHHDRVMVAGDSGNDRQMFETGFRGVVPVNALGELKAIANLPMHYHSPYPAARGVLDGLQHFGFVI